MKKLLLSCLPVLLCLYLQAQTSVDGFDCFDYYDRKMPDTKDKYVILDFFATWCTPCIAALPHLDSLQRTFGKQLQVVAVTKEDRKTLSAFFARSPRLNNLSVSFIVNDSLLHLKFPHMQIPHEVILNRSGKMLTATSAKELTFDRIKQLVTGDANVSFPLKQDRKYYNNLSLTNQLMPTQIIRSQTVIADSIPGLPSVSGIKNDSTYTRYYFINMPLISLLQLVHHRPYSAPYKLTGTIDLNALICYEITVPKEISMTEMHSMMRSDLQSRFGLTTQVTASGQSPATVLLVTKNINIE